MSVVGLDFGSVNSVVALARRKGIDVVLNTESKRPRRWSTSAISRCVQVHAIARAAAHFFQSSRADGAFLRLHRDLRSRALPPPPRVGGSRSSTRARR